MTDDALNYLIRQFETAWKLTSFHLDGLTTAECLWRPAHTGLHVYSSADGTWGADWPTHERYDLGPPSIGWLTWHLCFWLSMVMDHSFGDALLTRETVSWPGSADAVRTEVRRLETEWRSALQGLSAADLQSTERTRWPFHDRPFGDVVAWVNIELTKNAAEIGYARFLYAASVT